VKHLAAAVGMPMPRLLEIAESADSFCEELILLDPAKPDRPRDVLNVWGDLRKVQDRLLRAVLMPKLSPSPHSHGSVRGRHVKTNVEPHLDSVFAFTADISNFYPTISRNRVYRLFVSQFGCTPDVARLCTRLCTYRHHLALGLVTSPFLAEQVLIPIDRRLAAACAAAGLVYTRYVDDLNISGRYDLQRSGFESVVERILTQHGFKMHPEKLDYGRLSKGMPITKITIRKGHPDVRREYLAELDRQLDDANNPANGREFNGPYYTRNQIAGRVQFVCWINRGRKRKLAAKYNSIPWRKVEIEAVRRELVAAKKKLVKKPLIDDALLAGRSIQEIEEVAR
jgi:hypothetical protein